MSLRLDMCLEMTYYASFSAKGTDAGWRSFAENNKASRTVAVDVCPFVGSTHCEIFRSTKVSEGREEEGQTFGTGSRREELVRLQTYRQSQGQR
jgi:hypothetical protein